jgi:hypothetical protein
MTYVGASWILDDGDEAVSSESFAFAVEMSGLLVML